MITLLALDRAGATVVCVAPDVGQATIVNHLTGEAMPAKPKRNARVESARMARGKVRNLAELDARDVDALIIPGGEGVGTNLSNYAEKGELCEVNPDVARLLRAMLSSRKPIGLICLAPILGARILGPVAGVRLTLGARGSTAAKHAAVMGADVRPCPVDDVVVDQKSRVISTPAYMYDDARLAQVAAGVDKLVRAVLSLARESAQPRPPAEQQPSVPQPVGAEPSEDVTGPTRGSA
jgi:enhancing lycopene biosynthesis protein 2